MGVLGRRRNGSGRSAARDGGDRLHLAADRHVRSGGRRNLYLRRCGASGRRQAGKVSDVHSGNIGVEVVTELAFIVAARNHFALGRYVHAEDSGESGRAVRVGSRLELEVHLD